ncbi:MAG: paraslipin, partial [Ignavibacteriaceae bacterium]|nr:paraslipin [Ignavibacteriaceae bacterium]
MDGLSIVLIALAIFIVIIFLKTIRIVPQRSAFIIERLGKYKTTFDAGFHILVPFIDKVSYKLSLKEHAIDVESQQCITRDNIAVEVDGILYLQVIDPKKAAYGIDNYRFASTQIAQTTMRSIIG